MKNIERIGAMYMLSKNEPALTKLTKEQLEQLVKTKLAEGLANEIIKNIENLPVEYRQINAENETTYMLKINLISSEELQRLKENKQDKGG